MSGKKYRRLVRLGHWILISDDIPSGLEYRLLAALVSFSLGNRSMDRTFEEYIEIWKHRKEQF